LKSQIVWGCAIRAVGAALYLIWIVGLAALKNIR
jgi:hypothetical protein